VNSNAKIVSEITSKQFQLLGIPRRKYYFDVWNTWIWVVHSFAKPRSTHTMWAPLVISWFIHPINYVYKYHEPQLVELFAPTERYHKAAIQ